MAVRALACLEFLYFFAQLDQQERAFVTFLACCYVWLTAGHLKIALLLIALNFMLLCYYICKVLSLSVSTWMSICKLMNLDTRKHRHCDSGRSSGVFETLFSHKWFVFCRWHVKRFRYKVDARLWLEVHLSYCLKLHLTWCKYFLPHFDLVRISLFFNIANHKSLLKSQ